MRALLCRVLFSVLLVAGFTAVASGGPAVASSQDCLSYTYDCTPGYTGANASDTWSWQYYGAGYAQTPNGYHNCTLYVAWRLGQSGMGDPGRSWGNAYQWASSIGGGNHTPAVGSIAWYGTEVGGGFGHVAYVEQVSGANVYIRADNFSYTKGYTDAGWVAASSVDLFLHPHDVGGSGSTGGGGTQGASPTSGLTPGGGFEGGGSWAPYPGTRSNVVLYRNGQVKGESAHSGLHYLATNTPSTGGGAFEDVPLSTPAGGGLFCGSAWVRTQIGSRPASGQFVVWLLGGSYNENGVATFSGLGSGTNWRQVSTCVSSTTAHSVMRIQVYPTPGGSTVDVDDIDIHQSIASGGGFEGGGSWAPYPGTRSNVVLYRNGQVKGESAHSGLHYLATNTPSTGGGAFEDVPLSTPAGGGLFCGSAWVRTQIGSRPASGQFVVWLLGGSYNENGVATFSGLGSGTNWRQVSTCVSSTTAHSVMRIQVYPTPGGSTVDVDDIDIHQSIASGGGFEGGGSWAPYPGTRSNVVLYRNGQVKGESAHSGLHYLATNTPSTGGGAFEDVPLSTPAGGGLFCGSAWVRTQIGSRPASGQFVVWLLGGSYNENGVATFSGLGSGTNWRQVSTCVSSTTAHSVMRIQVYPTPGGSTVDVDDIDIH